MNNDIMTYALMAGAMANVSGPVPNYNGENLPRSISRKERGKRRAKKKLANISRRKNRK